MSKESSKKTEMDLTLGDRGIWLVKVPNYVANVWDKCPGDMRVATMRIETVDNQQPAKTRLMLNPELMKLAPGKQIAIEHEIRLCPANKVEKNTAVFSTLDESCSSFEGWVSSRMECVPVYNDQYLKMKKQSLQEVKPRRTAKPLYTTVKNFKPISKHIHNDIDGRSKKEVAARVLSRDNIMNMLFKAFEKHQYYTLKDLQFITKQSVFILRTILKDIGEFNKNPAHSQMWELKEEYRHYETGDEDK